jgi:hypothetical protein
MYFIFKHGSARCKNKKLLLPREWEGISAQVTTGGHGLMITQKSATSATSLNANGLVGNI